MPAPTTIEMALRHSAAAGFLNAITSDVFQVTETLAAEGIADVEFTAPLAHRTFEALEFIHTTYVPLFHARVAERAAAERAAAQAAADAVQVKTQNVLAKD